MVLGFTVVKRMTRAQFPPRKVWKELIQTNAETSTFLAKLNTVSVKSKLFAVSGDSK